MATSRKSYAAGDRATEDPALSRVPRCVLHDPTIVAMFDTAREYRRMAENLVLAEAEFEAGKISPPDMRTVQAKYDQARGKWLQADERVRRASS